MLELTPADPIIRTYLKELQHLKDHRVVHELGLKGPFQNLLDKAARKRGWCGEPLVDASTFSLGHTRSTIRDARPEWSTFGRPHR